MESNSLGNWKPISEFDHSDGDLIINDGRKVWINDKTLRVIYLGSDENLVLANYDRSGDEVEVLDEYSGSEDWCKVEAINKMQVYMCHDNGMTEPSELLA